MTGSVHSLEPDAERARRTAEEGMILHALVGSTVHGLANPGTDDRDEMGVCNEPPEYVLGEDLKALPPAFLFRRTGQAFLGYLEAQRRGLVGERHATRTRELSSHHGYDTKYAMHALRLGVQGLELLRTGRMTLPVPEPERTLLRAVRAGELPLADVLAELDDVTRRLRTLTDASALPAQGDAARIDSFPVRAYRSA